MPTQVGLKCLQPRPACIIIGTPFHESWLHMLLGAGMQHMGLSALWMQGQAGSGARFGMPGGNPPQCSMYDRLVPAENMSMPSSVHLKIPCKPLTRQVRSLGQGQHQPCPGLKVVASLLLRVGKRVRACSRIERWLHEEIVLLCWTQAVPDGRSAKGMERAADPFPAAPSHLEHAHERIPHTPQLRLHLLWAAEGALCLLRLALCMLRPAMLCRGT